MNDASDKLFEDLGRIGHRSGKQAAKDRSGPDVGSKLVVPDEMDNWRIHLVDLIYLFNATFLDAHYWEGVKAEKDTFEQLANVLRELEKLPDHDGIIHIRHRGSSNARVAEKIDYVIQFGGVVLDVASVTAMTKRMGIRVKHLEGRLTQSFKTLHRQRTGRAASR